MTPQEKLKQAAEHIAKHDFEEYSNDYETVVSDMVMLATSEAAREYWQRDAIEFAEWCSIKGWRFNQSCNIWFNTHRTCYNKYTEELYKEFIKQKQ